MGTNSKVLLVRKNDSYKVLYSGITESCARCLCDYLKKLDKNRKFNYLFQREK